MQSARIYQIFKMASIFSLMLVLSQNQAQDDFDWWNEAHHYDGYTHWTNFIIYSPYYLGPNALEVPYSQKGKVEQKGSFELEGFYHTSGGDQTQNLKLSLYYPFFENRIAVEFYYVPLEFYQMDRQTILERRTRYLDGSGTAQGDFYFSTIIQLIRDKRFPDIALRMACRTASGTDLGNARFTDAPGYFFDLSGGKDLLMGREDHTLRLHAMAGFYSWQMNLPDNKQNDAILYGAGLDLTLKKWYIHNALEGYIGYFGNQMVIVGDPVEPVPFKDRPMLYRLKAGHQFDRFDVSFGFHRGLQDFPYTSFSVGVRYVFEN